MHPDDRERFQLLYGRAVEQKRGWENAVIRWLHKDGTVRLLESSAQPILDTEGYVTGFTGIDRDITEIKRKKNIKTLKRKMMGSEKMASGSASLLVGEHNGLMVNFSFRSGV